MRRRTPAFCACESSSFLGPPPNRELAERPVLAELPPRPVVLPQLRGAHAAVLLHPLDRGVVRPAAPAVVAVGVPPTLDRGGDLGVVGALAEGPAAGLALAGG